jgi:iron complex outermembrane receptor protein
MGGLVLQQQQNRYEGRYFIPNYTATAAGIFYLEKWNNKKWECQAGFRYDDKQLQTQRLRWNNSEINHDFRFSTAAASFHLLYQSNEHFKWNTGLSLSSRAPHVNELLSNGIHHGTATYEKGDIQLKPERSLHFSLGLDWQDHQQKMALEVLVYANRIQNFIYLQPRPDQPVLTIAGAFPLMQYMQTDALLQGSDISFRTTPLTRWETTSKCSFLQAKNLTTNDWLVWMPANRFSQEIMYRFRDGKKIKHAYISTELSHVMRQYNTPDESLGKQDYKAPPAAYTRVDLQASLTLSVWSKPLVVSLGVRNLLDTAYRDYLNSMRYFTDEMGRNISIRWKYSL